ncbi:MAG: type II toxin-antitoxin system VapC family toxin [Chloroflexi bacterium]|nr:type II toxin-antitoxin system VapC family toxin [Chloroflexota bacterium]MBI3742495.1 type II toxin-antitoxin system VapC family toxin [Chloroflexota bacterium]
MILVDTDVMIDLLRQYAPALQWLDSLGDAEIILPGFVVMELIQGCKSKAEQEKVESNLEAYSITWPTSEICDQSLQVFADHHLSHGLGIIDALIGQMAVAMGLELLTFNQKHYTAISKLKMRQPYDRK